jgi:large subunit ribosomal protein L24
MTKTQLQTSTMTIKKGDNVLVIAGKDKGRQGAVEKVVRKDNRVVVTGINMRKKHLKPSQQNPRGGIIEFPGSMSRSNLMVICPHCSKPTRVGHTTGAEGKRYRFCKKCQGSLDTR